MPLSSLELLGTQKDGSPKKIYCKYCYENGEFKEDRTLEEEIEHLIPMYIDDRDISKEEARRDYTDVHGLHHVVQPGVVQNYVNRLGNVYRLLQSVDTSEFPRR